MARRDSERFAWLARSTGVIDFKYDEVWQLDSAFINEVALTIFTAYDEQAYHGQGSKQEERTVKDKSVGSREIFWLNFGKPTCIIRNGRGSSCH